MDSTAKLIELNSADTAALVALRRAGLTPRHHPERVVDDLVRVLQRAQATSREVRLLLALIRNLGGWP